MNRYERTSIWQKTLGKQSDNDTYEKERELLRTSFESFRERAALLAGEIARNLPEFTVHDITHIDGLWENAELVAKDIFLTPCEGFVLGGAFLIHDLGMGVAAFPMGVDELKKETIWKDNVASIFREKNNRHIKEDDFSSLEPEIERIALENTLRLLHAQQAEKLALISWESNGNKVFLIENDDLRNSYGEIIGLIAHSHWWSVDEVGEKFTKILGVPSRFPSDWEVDPIKLACILRISDATQIDDRRAPSFLRTIRKPTAYSDLHWNFQQKLYQPRLEHDRLVYTSKSSFKIEEIDSWWLCYDTLKMIDLELKSVDALLADTNKSRLNATGVAYIEDPKRLSKQIGTEGWQPVDTQIKVTNVARLATTLGGEQLYGNDMSVPLRELIQNSSDAIRARRMLEDARESFGDIIVRLGKDKFGDFIEVEDNGIGMSSKVLTGPFLDFGKSFWGMPLMHEELPGLEAKGFKSTGKHGIGFFSVFMWGQKISVASRRYEMGRDTTLILEFNKGASSRPILRKASDNEIIRDGGTRIRVWLSSDKVLKDLFKSSENEKISLTELTESLCPSIDCNVIVEDEEKTIKVITANDWLTISSLDLIIRIIGRSVYKKFGKDIQKRLGYIAKNMSQIEENGVIVGRACLYRADIFQFKYHNLHGTVTVGGLKSSDLSGIIGILIGESNIASRHIGIPIISNENLKYWISKQADLLTNLSLGSATEIACSSIARRCGADTMSLKIGFHVNKPLSYTELKDIIYQNDFESYFVIDELQLLDFQRNKHFKIILFENLFMIRMMGYPVILQNSKHNHKWPVAEFDEEKRSGDFYPEGLQWLILKACSEVWNCTINELTKSIQRQSNVKIGTLNNEDLVISHASIIHKPKKKQSGRAHTAPAGT